MADAPVVYLTTEMMKDLIHQLAVAYFSQYGEPIPDYKLHNHARLESSLALPQASFGGEDLYPTIAAKAAILFYVLVKNHPFPNGNKRLATTALLVFLYLNNVWLVSEQRGVYRWAVRVAGSKREEQSKILHQMTRWLERNMESRSHVEGSRGLFGRMWRALNWLVPRFSWRRRTE